MPCSRAWPRPAPGWGAEEAEVIWDTCTYRMIFPGGANQRDNKMISEMLGEFDEIGRH